MSNEHGSALAQTDVIVTKPEPIVFNTSVTVYADEPIVVDNVSYGGNTFFNILAAAGYTYTYGDSESGYSDRKPPLTLTIDDVTYPTRLGALNGSSTRPSTGDDRKFKKSRTATSTNRHHYIWAWRHEPVRRGLTGGQQPIYVVELTVDFQPTRPGALPVVLFRREHHVRRCTTVAFTDTDR